MITLLVSAAFLTGCVVGVESVGDAPVSNYNPGDDTAERMYTPAIQERAAENAEENKSWEAGGRPAPSGGWEPYWEYY